METKSTVAIDDKIRRTIKKIAVLLDISQGEVIQRAIHDYEKLLIAERNMKKHQYHSDPKSIEDIFQEAENEIYAQDPEFKKMNEKLFEGPESIDDFIVDNWNTGLDE